MPAHEPDPPSHRNTCHAGFGFPSDEQREEDARRLPVRSIHTTLPESRDQQNTHNLSVFAKRSLPFHLQPEQSLGRLAKIRDTCTQEKVIPTVATTAKVVSTWSVRTRIS